jgi:hypothetical protein
MPVFVTYINLGFERSYIPRGFCVLPEQATRQGAHAAATEVLSDATLNYVGDIVDRCGQDGEIYRTNDGRTTVVILEEVVEEDYTSGMVWEDEIRHVLSVGPDTNERRREQLLEIIDICSASLRASLT